jgi:hypothetical protein
MSMNIQEQFNKLSLGEKIIIVAAPLLFIVSFLQWFNYDLGPFGDISRSGWSGDFSFFTIIASLVALVMLAQIVLTRFTSVALPALPQGITWGRIHLGAGVYILIAVALRMLIGESAGGVDADRSYGIFIAIILAIALAAGGFLMFQEEQKGGGATPPAM